MNPKLRKIICSISGAMICLVSCTRAEHVDVLIIGGGASGICAGIQSARMGVHTMIVEETPWLGGMLTAAGVSCIDGNYKLQSGLFGEFADSLAARYGSWDALKSGWVSNICFEPHVGQEILTDMAAGCGDLLQVKRKTITTKVEKVGGMWNVVLESDNSRKYRITADVLIDATELGDVAKACGVDYRIGMESSSDTGENIAPDKANDVIQDLTFVTILKDYGKDSDMTISRPDGYDPSPFFNCSVNHHSTEPETGQTLWSPQLMITYGRTPGGKYMINWPIYGNDYYVNSIEMTRDEREDAYRKAKEFTLSFVYFIQTELGMKNLAPADDEFPTDDGLALIPYHRESRRIVGEAFFTLDAAADPYGFSLPYYRTGVAVGDYAVDHHHFRHPDWRTLPDLHFYPIPSFNVPLGVLIPQKSGIENLIVAEKSVSVSNLINGATRLQPVVMQLGQAAGTIAALSCIEDRPVKEISVRSVQNVLLDAGCYLMPYLDLPKDHQHFKAVQKIGATGILRGEGRNVGWANQTWFRTDDPLIGKEIFIEDYLHGEIPLNGGPVNIGQMLDIIRHLGISVPDPAESWWSTIGLTDYDPDRTITRLEAAVTINAAIDPFNMYDVGYDGNILR